MLITNITTGNILSIITGAELMQSVKPNSKHYVKLQLPLFEYLSFIFSI